MALADRKSFPRRPPHSQRTIDKHDPVRRRSVLRGLRFSAVTLHGGDGHNLTGYSHTHLRLNGMTRRNAVHYCGKSRAAIF